ncbi:hypothetical protein ACJ6VE_06665 [Escherichia coli]|uniref:glycine-rich domain-containing protein n=1 Tax=Escherichia coli TaxID=562 RepID=UPI0038969F4D
MIYSTGTISINGNTATGSGTNWTAPASQVRAGQTIIVMSNPVQMFQISSVNSATSMTVTPAASPALSGQNYGILVSDNISVDGLALAMSQLIKEYDENIGAWETFATTSANQNITVTINGTSLSIPALGKLLQKGSNGALPVNQGGTGATNAADARTNLGLGASAFGLTNCVVFSTPGVTNWNVPSELQAGRKAKITVIGGGGSGGRAEGGGGGGAGGLSTKLIDLTGVSSVAITVGGGGVAPEQATDKKAGVAGRTSSFGSYCSATGGEMGATPSGGLSGIGVGGDFNTGLGPGCPGVGYGSYFCSGSGGGAGGNGAASLSRVNGADGIGPGGGGSGAAGGASLVSCKAGNGMDGIVIIEW